MNVLSLFDGMSCGQIALERAGIKVDNYYASEIDKYAIKVTQANYPNTIQLGDVTQWQSWGLPKIDLLMGGSPCQGFSMAGNGLNFKDPRSKLFFTFVDILKHYKPEHFLLENVRMKKEWQQVISEHVGVEPIMINSALVSAQNRRRLYWNDIKGVTQPEDKLIYLKDILEDGVDEKYLVSDEQMKKYRGGNQLNPSYKSQANTIHEGKSATICAGTHGYSNGYVKVGTIGKDSQATRVYSTEGKSTTLNAHGGGMGAKTGLYMILQRPRGNNQGGLRALDGKTPTLSSSSWEHNNYLIGGIPFRIRRLTPIECERLQTVPDRYTDHVSNTQRYKMLGNGWTVDVVAHILKGVSCHH